MVQIYTDSNDRDNPYVGSNWSVEDLLTAFSHEVCTYMKTIALVIKKTVHAITNTELKWWLFCQELNDVCIGHLFTYNEFRGSYIGPSLVVPRPSPLPCTFYAT